MATYRDDTKKIVAGMGPWRRRYGGAISSRKRTNGQRAFDSGVLAASEFVRRITGDETLALQIHAMLTPTDKDSIGLPIKSLREME